MINNKELITRGAGILLPIASLPSRYGIGDMGTEAFKWVDSLKRSDQRFWQLLPVNPTQDDHSPYNATSAMAGNPLFISAELLYQQGLLTKKELRQSRLRNTSIIQYEQVITRKSEVLDCAYHKFTESAHHSTTLFEEFCKKEADWLQDFALFTVIKTLHQEIPWYQWPEDVRSRSHDALNRIADEHAGALRKVKWIQFVFHLQWEALKKYCHRSDVVLIGDMPFYVGYDSADVWSNPGIFDINETGKLITVAGSPPDPLHSDGQLWGMPAFKWEVLKDRNYYWWLKRIKKQLEFYDLIRLDHFRAFASYWAVPAGSATAAAGSWQAGPGSSLFERILQEIGHLPFIAEDLGTIDDAVRELRDQYLLPGMNVFHYAFSGDFPESPYLPHRHQPLSVVYTGTHDTDTTVGWFTELSKKEKRNLLLYSGQSVSKKNVHLVLMRMAYSSVSEIAIVPWQDIMGLDGHARINVPGKTTGNWTWRITQSLPQKKEQMLRQWAILYQRGRA